MPSVVCKICDETFADEGAFKHHILEDHNDSERNRCYQTCPFCTKGVKPTKVHICGTNSCLSQHNQCTVCRKHFDDTASMLYHFRHPDETCTKLREKWVTPGKRFRCNFCGDTCASFRAFMRSHLTVCRKLPAIVAPPLSAEAMQERIDSRKDLLGVDNEEVVHEWSFKESDKSIPYQDHHQYLLTKAFLEGKEMVTLRLYQGRTLKGTYRVDFETMEQTNTRTGVTRKVSIQQNPIGSIHDMILNDMLGLGLGIDPDWDVNANYRFYQDPRKPFALADVKDPDVLEGISDQLKVGFPEDYQPTVMRVERIMAPYLEWRYQQHKDELHYLHKEEQSSIKSGFCWHGVWLAENYVSIFGDGFDPKRSILEAMRRNPDSILKPDPTRPSNHILGCGVYGATWWDPHDPNQDDNYDTSVRWGAYYCHAGNYVVKEDENVFSILLCRTIWAIDILGQNKLDDIRTPEGRLADKMSSSSGNIFALRNGAAMVPYMRVTYTM